MVYEPFQSRDAYVYGYIALTDKDNQRAFVDLRTGEIVSDADVDLTGEVMYWEDGLYVIKQDGNRLFFNAQGQEITPTLKTESSG